MMKPGLAYYLATSRPDGSLARCCEDLPLGFTATEPRREPGAVRTALRGTVSVLRGAFRLPTSATSPAVGSSVVTADGEYVGRVADVVIGLRSGNASFAVASTRPGDVVWLLPRGAFREGSVRNVFVVDPEALELPLAA